MQFLYSIRCFISPLMSLALVILSNGFFVSFISLRLQLEGYDGAFIGYVQSAYYAGLLVGAARVERLIRRIGHIRAYAIFASITTMTTLIQGLDLDIMLWVSMRFLAGISLAGLFVVIESWLLDGSTLENRGVVLSIYMIALYTSQALGQFIINFVNLKAPEPYLVAGILAAASAIPVSFTRAKSPDLHEPTLASFFTLFKASPFGFSSCVFSGLILSAIYSFTPTFAQSNQIPVAMMVSLTIAGGVALQWPIGKLSDLMDRRIVLIGVCLLLTLPSFLIPMALGRNEAVYLATFFLGGLAFTIYPLGITQACDRVDSHNITAITGALLIAYGSGAAVGPLAAPLFIDNFGSTALYYYIAAMGTILAVIGIIGMMKRPPVPVEEREVFVALPPSSSVAYDLDPRAPAEEEQEVAAKG